MRVGEGENAVALGDGTSCGGVPAEGVIPGGVTGGQWQQWQRDYFAPAWDRLNAGRGFGWDSSPWVWRVAFRGVGGCA